jgi:hypothetical protein
MRTRKEETAIKDCYPIDRWIKELDLKRNERTTNSFRGRQPGIQKLLW